ncbi:hypothetical protein N7450_008916 [Penicillium hetheringtonii]|uniref:Uncharacterized protein n=1 Tax=Penicillium hetheringtonii TaxID=911720 RepID=A0AAD6DE13_9EURO|nr:hypothetical protein N7450_008916 [Penicillium hetheringtonii]
MEMTIFLLLKTLAVAFIVYKLGWFAIHYHHARRSGLPIYVVPVFSKSTLWLVLATALQPQLQKLLPEFLYDRIDVLIHGWEFRRGRWYHDRLGSTFVVVTPDEFTVWCADPIMGNTILQKRNEFQQAPIANGDEW